MEEGEKETPGKPREMKEKLPPAGISSSEAIQRMKEGRGEIKGGAPGWLLGGEGEVDVTQITDQKLRKLVEAADRRHVNMISAAWLLRFYDRVDELDIPYEEKGLVLDRIAKYHEINFGVEEIETKKKKRTETDRGHIEERMNDTFALVSKGIEEGKKFEDMYSDWTGTKEAIKTVPDKAGVKHEELSRYLKSKYPEGVYLREKLELFFESMRRLHKRYLEVVAAEGGLVDLGSIKGGEGLAPELKVPFENLEPLDWYVLTHLDEMFPEAGEDKELRISIEKPWKIWREIGSQPYLTEKEKEENKRRKDKDKLGRRGLRFIKIGDKNVFEIGGEKYRFALEDFYASEAVEKIVREAIVKEKGVGKRAEQITHMMLTIGLTYDMWDRQRWKQKGKQEARDLMWFDYKRKIRVRDFRPGGPLDTVGCYWAEEDQDRPLRLETMIEKEKDRKKKEELRRDKRRLKEEARIRKQLARNKERALFLYTPGVNPPEGTLIGDFFTSNTVEVGGKPKRLSDYASPKDIPWLKPGMFEKEVYSGYFGYSLLMAAMLRDKMTKLDWDPRELKGKEFWVGLHDLSLRVAHYCPWVITRDVDSKGKEMDKNQREQLTLAIAMKLRRILARGIFWTGSYLASANPDSLLAKGTFSKDDVYGRSVLLAKTAPGILDAIEASGYLDGKNTAILEDEIYDFNFHTKGGVGRR